MSRRVLLGESRPRSQRQVIDAQRLLLEAQAKAAAVSASKPPAPSLVTY